LADHGHLRIVVADLPISQPFANIEVWPITGCDWSSTTSLFGSSKRKSR
jgi:hypothetical protein